MSTLVRWIGRQAGAGAQQAGRLRGVETTQLQSTPGFAIYDLANAENYVGPVRLGTKLIPSNATMLVRHQTYVFATLEMQRSGATIGLKSDPADVATAVSALANELAEEFSSQRLLVAPGLRLDANTLSPVLAHDKRNQIFADEREGISFGDELLGVGASTAAAAALDGDIAAALEGKKVAIEGFNTVGLALAREVAARGATVIAVSTDKGCASGDFSPAALADALFAGGAAGDTASNTAGGAAGGAAGDTIITTLADSHGGTAGKSWEIWGSEADVIFCGSKPGALSGEGATAIIKNGTGNGSTGNGGAAVVPWTAAAVSSKALAALRNAGNAVVGDFVSAVGPALSWWASPETTHDQLREQTQSVVEAVMSETAGHEDGYYMSACYRAERFMSTWLDELPFGRPLG